MRQKATTSSKKDGAEALIPRSTCQALPAEEARRAHEAALERARDLGRDVVVSAGAGTGKTYSLVLRYLEALAAGASPQEILAITFTRRAAAEMAHRVRQALLNPAPGHQAELAGRLRAAPERFRRILLTLSAAPISTLDSLALRIVQEADRLRVKLSGGVAPASPSQVMAGSELSGLVQGELTDRFLLELEQGDADLARLLDHVTPGRLRALLQAAAEEGKASDALLDAEGITKLWWRLIWRSLTPLVEPIQALDLDAWEGHLAEALELNAKTKRLSEEGEASVRAALEAARAIQAQIPEDPAVASQHVLAILCCSTAKEGKVGLGANDLRRWIREHIPSISASFLAGGAENAELLKALRKLGEAREPDLPRWADLACAANRVVRRWSEGLSEKLDGLRQLRHADVERRALGELQDASMGSRLAERFPVKHIFLDESQDTNQVQLDIVRHLARHTGARYFWVGDVKQSIYRFRGAEVDVFQRMEALGKEEQAEVLNLTVNRRSSRPLITAFNRLFGALLPARTGEVEHDPDSEMDYVPLTWLKAREGDSDEPGIELIAAPGSRWELDEAAAAAATRFEAEDGDDDAGEDESAECSELERALVQRIKEITEEVPRGAQKDGPGGAAGTGPRVAVLVHAWSRADHYRDLLMAHGVRCVVQGGRGLLSTPEVGHLLCWLQAAALRSRLGLLGVLRGPGVAISDTGLFCLQRGYGLSDEAGQALAPEERYLTQVVRRCRLDPGCAVDPFERACRAGDLAGAVEGLLDEACLRAYWLEQAGGPQRLANLNTFVDLLRAKEQAGGAPAELVSALLQIRDQDDPAEGSLEAGGDTPVCITTYWQAKGREWPVVVLPDLERTKTKADALGVGSERLVLGAEREVLHVPSAVETTEKKPFGATTPAPIKALINRHRMPAERAELRRLLYVAMTRAKERVVLSAVFNRPKQGTDTIRVPMASGKVEQRVTLGQAKSWARTLQVATGLSFDKEGKPTLGDGVWSEEDLRLVSPASLAAALAQPTSEERPGPLAVTPELLARLAPVESELVPHLSPSKLKGAEMPAPWKVHGAYPAECSEREHLLSASDEGTCLHALFEHWGYGQGTEPTAENIQALLASQVLGSGMHPEDDAEHLLAMFQRSRQARPELVATLTAAAAQGELFHEIPLRYRVPEGDQVSGDIDLLWHDQEGWHILDYKAGTKAPTADAPLESDTLKKHYAQVLCYARGVEKMLGEPVADFGIWYTRYALAVRWAG